MNKLLHLIIQDVN